MKITFMQMNEPMKWITPSVSFILRPVAFGNQKYTPANNAKIVPGATT
jgi:hypothetical protein